MGLTVAGRAPGTLTVVVDGTYVGGIRPDGEAVGALAGDDALQAHLAKVALDPAKAAKEYAALMGACSFCSKPLTDEGSVEVGYGPVCAKHWGLPHRALGTKALHEVI
jgi:hypothetical protein